MEERKIPKRLYKYRSFNGRTLDMLVSDNLYYADPSTFNDPLDTQPSLRIDVTVDDLREILGHFVKRRTESEMSAAAKTIKYSGPKTIEHIKRQSQRQSEHFIAEMLFNAPYPECDDRLPILLAQKIEMELLQQYDKGIVSLAGRATCPLMWSHYGDQHHGVLHWLFGAETYRK